MIDPRIGVDSQTANASNTRSAGILVSENANFERNSFSNTLIAGKVGTFSGTISDSRDEKEGKKNKAFI